MRDPMRKAMLLRDQNRRYSIADHMGLAYDIWAPTEQDGKIQTDNSLRRNWLNRLAHMPIPPDYHHAQKRWASSFCPPSDHTAQVHLEARLLLGSGNSAPTEVGLTVHHIWGVPLLPGSTLKGLTAHYVESCYGPEGLEDHPLRSTDPRARWVGPTWKDRYPAHGPGDVYRMLFGSPDAQSDGELRQERGEGAAVGARRGVVVFHDAWMVPTRGDSPWEVDVLTVHNKKYYNQRGSEGAPCDYDDPNPVDFLTVRPGTAFQLALSGPPPLAALALHLLLEALKHWGIGSKTSRGYGRGTQRQATTAQENTKPLTSRAPPATHPKSVYDKLSALLDTVRALSKIERIERVEKEWLPLLKQATAEDRERSYTLIKDRLKIRNNPRKATQHQRWLALLAQVKPASGSVH